MPRRIRDASGCLRFVKTSQDIIKEKEQNRIKELETRIKKLEEKIIILEKVIDVINGGE